jgi:hypothetical protein
MKRVIILSGFTFALLLAAAGCAKDFKETPTNVQLKPADGKTQKANASRTMETEKLPDAVRGVPEKK